MSIHRRLINLENRPFQRPVARPTHTADMDRALQELLCLPVPDDATDAERAACLELLIDAQARLRIDRGDTGGCDDMRRFALELHRKYG